MRTDIVYLLLFAWILVTAIFLLRTFAVSNRRRDQEEKRKAAAAKARASSP